MDSQRPESVHRRHFTWSITFILMVTTLIWPAFHNGFPLVFYDTGGYLARPFERTLEIGRSVLYGAFLALGSPLDFWPNIVAQAALAAWLVLLALRSHGFGHRPILALFVTLTLAFLTSLPWHAAQLMPDILVPEAVLALYLIAFRRCALRRLEAVLLCAVIAFAIASHMATLGLMLGLLAVALGLQLLGSRLARPQLATPALAVVAGVGLALFSNLAIAGRFTFTPGAATIAFVRLVDHGITKRYLDDKCPDTTIMLCAYRNELQKDRDTWIWGETTPLNKLGGWEKHDSEAQRIFLESLALYPGRHLKSALSNTLEQFMRAKTGDRLSPWTWHVRMTIERYAPDSYPRFIAARQQNERFDFTWLNFVHIPVFALSTAALPVFVGLAGTRVRRSVGSLALFVLFALLGNAAICGTFASPHDRYQSRLVPLAALTVAIAVLAAGGAPRQTVRRARSA